MGIEAAHKGIVDYCFAVGLPKSLIDLAAGGHRRDGNHLGVLIDYVQNSPVADPRLANSRVLG